MSISIIINPIAGGASAEQGRARAELASAIVDKHGDPAEIFLTEHRGHARTLAKASLQRGARLVMAWGGDGTINEVASALAFQDVPLGIVPAGSGNGLARELGVSMQADRAIAEAIAAVPRPLDVGEIDDHLFVNLAGIGFDAHVAAQFDAPGNRRRGFLGYISIAARALIGYVPQRYVISLPEKRIESRAVLVTAANSAQFGNGATIAPGARVDDGLLDLVVVEETARWRTVIQVPRLFMGTVDRMPGCSIHRFGRATIEAERPMLYHVDGEPVEGGTTVKIRVHPGALRVAVR